tara:strand:- start:152 stop:748 length:597 start_codon:yes stop_codon:yes gene_type:complete
MLRNLVDNDNFIPYWNCFRGSAIVTLFILIDVYRDNELFKFIGIFAIIVIVFSFICISRRPRIRREYVDHRVSAFRRLRRNQHAHNEIMLDIIQQVNADSVQEYLQLVRDQTVCYRLGLKDPHIGEECCICLDEFKYKSKVCRLECCHLFHKKCIEKWLLEKPICPLCKYDIFEELDIIIEIDDDDDDDDDDDISIAV